MSRAKIGQHAVVVGGGFVGLLMSRVLSDYFDKVTVIERDVITDENIFNPRTGAPQGLHTHFLTTKGAEVLEKLFPKLEEMLLTHGSRTVDFLQDAKRYQYGSWKPRFKSGKSSFIQSRPLLEGCIRSLVKEIGNITFLYQNEAHGLLWDPKQKRISGVRVKNNSTSEEQNIYAEFVVDASGRNTHFPDWLEGFGFEKPEKIEVKVDISYLSCEFSLPENFHPDWEVMAIYRWAPFKKKSGIVIPLESKTKEKRALVTLMGQHGDFPVATLEGFLDYARQLEAPDLYELIKDAQPITQLTTYKVPVTWRYNYSKVKDLPGGFMAVGDAICTLNPIYAQGMSVAALEVALLDQMLAENPQHYLDNIRRHYFKRAEKIINGPWDITTHQDYVYPETEGKRPFGFAFARWYRYLVTKAANNPVVWKALFDISYLEKEPKSLFRPAILIRVLPKMFSKWGD